METVVLQASQFTPVTFEAVVVGYELTKSVSRLAARLLAVYGELTDDELGLRIPTPTLLGPRLQLAIRGRGLLNVTPFWASFKGAFSQQEITQDQYWASEPVRWAIDMLMLVVNTQKSPVALLTFGATWLLTGHNSTAALVAHFGLSQSLGGFFSSSQDFEIRGDTNAELPDLFPVRCEVFAGRLPDLEGPESVGVEIKHRSPDKRNNLDAPVNFTRETVDLFFALSPQLMDRQLAQYFPTQGAT